MKKLFQGKKVFYIIIFIILIVSAVCYLIPADENDKINKLFGDYNKRYGLEIQKDGLFLGFKTESQEYKSGNNISFWINGTAFDGYLLIKSLFSSGKTFTVKTLLDYSSVNFSADNSEFNDSFKCAIGPRADKIIHIGLKNIPEGAHDLLIMILEENNSKIENITCLYRNIFNNSEQFPLLKKYNFFISEREQATGWHLEDNGKIKICVDAKYLKDSKTCALTAFQGDKQVLFNGNAFKLFNVPKDKNYKVAACFLKDVKDISGFFLLITEPFVPVEYSIGRIVDKAQKTFVVIPFVKASSAFTAR